MDTCDSQIARPIWAARPDGAGWLTRILASRTDPRADVRGLFYDVCLEVTGKLGLQVTAVPLMEHPMPVESLVVD